VARFYKWRDTILNPLEQKMKSYKPQKRVILTGFLFLAICMGIVSLGIYFVNQITRENFEPIYSPDHQNMVVPRINYDKTDMTKYLCIKISIVDTMSGNIKYEEQTSASIRMQWSISWLGNKFIILNSSDIGPKCWQENNGSWGSSNCPE
jgi:hypothetical protein